jgi:AraC family transcriptional regulator
MWKELLWYIERELGAHLELSKIAGHCGLSSFSMARVFAASTGWPVMRYVRARRLSQAAKALRLGVSDILEVALSAGYGSHEAFTRAFGEMFGITPKQARDTDRDLQLLEPLRLKEIKAIKLSDPRFETRPSFVIAGLGDRFTFEKNEGIVGLWNRFVLYMGSVPGQVDGRSYGLCCNPGDDGSFDYIAGVEVSASEGLPAGFRSCRVPEQYYAVFRHLGHISTTHQTFYTIFNSWLPTSEYSLADAPEFEQYSSDFNPSASKGFVEVWIPVSPAT